MTHERSVHPHSGRIRATYGEVAESIRDAIRRRVQQCVPSTPVFHPTQPLLFLLGQIVTTPTKSLCYVPLEGSDEAVPWRPLHTPIPHEPHARLPKEVQLQRERKRESSSGITSYCMHKGNGSCSFVTPLGGSLFTLGPVETEPQSRLPLIPTVSSEAMDDTATDPKWSHDGTFLSFVRRGDLHVKHVVEGWERQLTFSGTKTAGVAEFIIQEEFKRFTGYWWAPRQDPVRNVWLIVYLEVDEADVEAYSFQNPTTLDLEEPFHYPRAGSKNAVSELCLVEFDGTKEGEIVQRRLAPSLLHRFPWYEYIVRVGWMPDGQRVWTQLLDRCQQRLCLAVFSVQDFIPAWENHPSDKSSTVLHYETSPMWINVANILHFFDDESDRFVWSSEQSGWRHLYLVTPTYDGNSSMRPLTTGEWEIDGNFLEVDMERQRVFFLGAKDTPTEQHLYLASLAEGSDPTTIHRLTPPSFNHRVTLCVDRSLFVSIHSSLSSPFACTVHRISDPMPPTATDSFPAPEVSLLVNIEVPIFMNSTPPSFPMRAPELFQFTNSQGDRLDGLVFKPHTYEAGVRYPTLLYVYGGPGIQTVLNDYKITSSWNWQFLCSRGYVVVIMDGRGSSGRGVTFEGYARESLGTYEIDDQVMGLEYLSSLGLVDLQRVAVAGWSYGGYLSLMALVQRPDVFKLCVSASPVTMWELYDTAYTERYMGLPDQNKVEYERGSVLRYIHKFPNEENRLMLLHGFMDENVHYCHTIRLVEALVAANKPYRLHMFTKERHGLRDMSSVIFFYTAFFSFLEAYL